MEDDQAHGPRRRPGGRSARIREAVLATTVDVLADGGYPALTLDGVAERSGVHRSTLYRRWGSPAALVLDALLARSDRTVPVPDTGSFAGDVRQLLAEVRANLEDPVGGAATVAIAAERSEAAADGARRFWDDRLDRMRVVVERAVERGEVADGDEARGVIEVAVAPLFFRLLVRRTPIDDDLVDRVVSLLGRALATPPTDACAGGQVTSPSVG